MSSSNTNAIITAISHQTIDSCKVARMIIQNKITALTCHEVANIITCIDIDSHKVNALSHMCHLITNMSGKELASIITCIGIDSHKVSALELLLPHANICIDDVAGILDVIGIKSHKRNAMFAMISSIKPNNGFKTPITTLINACANIPDDDKISLITTHIESLDTTISSDQTEYAKQMAKYFDSQDKFVELAQLCNISPDIAAQAFADAVKEKAMISVDGTLYDTSAWIIGRTYSFTTTLGRSVSFKMTGVGEAFYSAKSNYGSMSSQVRFNNLVINGGNMRFG